MQISLWEITHGQNVKMANFQCNGPHLTRIMKAISTLALVFIVLSVVAQPGPDVIFPTDINLNQYPTFPRKIDKNGLASDYRKPKLGMITIDSTSDLSIIPSLKKEYYLALEIKLCSIPPEFTGFINTRILELSNLKDSVNVSFLNGFNNLEYLTLEHAGEVTFDHYVDLKSLKGFSVSFSKRLSSLEAFERINTLESISLKYVPQLKEFPEFDTVNAIKRVTLYQESGSGCTDCLPNSHNIDLANLSRLKHLEELHLHNINGLSEIPADLSKELREFRLSCLFRANKDVAVRSHIQDVSNFSKYKNLEIIELSGVYLKAFKGDFSALNLKRLSLRAIVGLEDISGIFTMQRVDHFRLELAGIQTIAGNSCDTRINNMLILNCPQIQNIDFLLSCEHINYLKLEGGHKLLLPTPEEWKIDNLDIYAKGRGKRGYIIKKEGQLIDSLNVRQFIR